MISTCKEERVSMDATLSPTASISSSSEAVSKCLTIYVTLATLNLYIPNMKRLGLTQMECFHVISCHYQFTNLCGFESSITLPD
jgi:hypothetical protein